jgi:heavy metal sensor kinase
VRLRIRTRLTLWYVVLLAVIIGAVGAFLVLRLRTDLTDAVDGALKPAADQIALGFRAEGRPEAHDVSATVLSGERAASQVLDQRGRIVAVWGDAVSRRPILGPAELQRVLRGARVERTADLGRPDARFRLAARPILRGGRSYAVVAAQSMAAVDRSVHRLLVLLLIACPAALLATAAGGWWLARRALAPVQRLTTQAQDIGMQRLDERLAVPPTRDELARLATTLNTMLARIEHGVDEQQRLIADASHELRSPLAAMRTELEVSLRADALPPTARAVLESTREEVVRLSRMVDDLLTLAGADEGGLDAALETVDVTDVAAAVIGALEPLARSRSIGLRLEGAPAMGRADGRLLRQALGNLVDNAIKYSPPGATVLVRTAANGHETWVRVEDEGPGVPPELRERVFDRFFRLDPSRTRATGGSGLGLAIAREIAWAHDGRVWVEPRAGGGSTFCLTVPR